MQERQYRCCVFKFPRFIVVGLEEEALSRERTSHVLMAAQHEQQQQVPGGAAAAGTAKTAGAGTASRF